MTDFTESYAYRLMKGILKYSKKKNNWVVCKMPPSFMHSYGVEGVVDWAKQWNADAIIGQFDSDVDVELFAKNGIIALAQDYKTRFDSIPNITGDYYETGEMAAKYFSKKGFNNFAFYGYGDAVWSLEREEGFRNYIKNNIADSNYSIFTNQLLDNIWHYEFKELSSWLLSLPLPIGIYVCDDTSAVRILEVCSVLGLKVPEEVAVLGTDDDTTLCDLCQPNLSSIKLDVENVGIQIAKMLDKKLENKDYMLHDLKVSALNIIERKSTDIYSATDPEIAKALQFIHENSTTDILVTDVVKQVPLSRRLLERRFKDVTGTSIYQYIIDLRIKKMSQLLLCTDLSVETLATEVGFSSIKNVSRLFKSRKGMTPTEYRLKKHN